MSCIGRCGIYESRPRFCREYPKPGDFLPPGCTYTFEGNERKGECQPESCQENCCCNYPREEGNPEGKGMDDKVGGLPCKFLVWQDEEDNEKMAADEAPSITGQLYEAVMPSIRGEDVR